MKILFVINQLDYADHISIAYLSAIAKKKGHKTALCILSQHPLLNKFIEFHPDVVAYSTDITGFNNIVLAHRTLKSIRKSFVSILGGPHATFSPGTFLDSGMDAYCIGEGEGAFSDFLDAVERGEAIYAIPNLITYGGSTPVRSLIQDLDLLPFPDRELTIANSHLKDVPKKTFYTTRGCPFSCSYCCNNYYKELYRGKGKIVRRFSVSRVLEEIRFVRSRFRTDFIKFGDDLFALKADDWLKEFAERYPREIGIPFNCYLRFDQVDKEVLQLLQQSGCYSVHLSVDSASEYVRENILHRQMKKIDIIWTLRLIRFYGMHTWVNFMLALPESTLEDDLTSLSICRKGKVTYPSFCTTDPMKGTALHTYCINKGYLDPSYEGDMTKLKDKSPLNCFSKKEKAIRYNIALLGSVAARSPKYLDWLFMFLIKYIPPNPVFRWIQKWFYKYSITHTIFKLPKGEIWKL
jgi:radical SAM superfamily enzyme YgiQ (UPF0313 family)